MAGYKIYHGSTQGRYEGVLDVGKTTTFTLTDLEEGKAHYFALVAYDVHGEESELSEEVAHHVRPTDHEGDTDENVLLDQEEAGQAESDHEPVPEVTGQLDALPVSGKSPRATRLARAQKPGLVREWFHNQN